MILPVLRNTKYRLLLSHVSLSFVLSSFFVPSLMASDNDFLGDNQEKILKRTRDKNHLNTTNNHNEDIDLPLEEERPLKIQKIEPTSGAILKVTCASVDGVAENQWVADDIVANFFFHVPISGVRAGRCVSKQLHRFLMSDDFCNYWGIHFSPSTPKAMGMTPQEFIRYWSTPSFRVLSKDGFTLCQIRAMSADGSVILGIGIAEDGADGDRVTDFQWIDGKIMTLPHLNNAISTYANGVNSDGSIIVGMENTFHKSTAVLWGQGKVSSIEEILKSAGLILGEHYLNSAGAISANGLQVAGTTGCSNGGRHFFKAILPSQYSQ